MYLMELNKLNFIPPSMPLGTAQPPIQLISRFFSWGYSGHDAHLHPAPRI